MDRNGQTTRGNKGILLAAAVAAAALSVLATNAPAASFTFINVSGTNWNTNSNWQGSSAPGGDGSASDDDRFFTGTTFTSGTTSINNDKGQTGSPKTVDLNALTLSGVGSNSGSGTRTINMTGDRLRFDTSASVTPVVNLDATNGSAVSVVYAVSENVVLNNNTTFQGDGTAGFTFSGAFSGTGSLTKTGSSTLTLTGTESYNGGTNVNGGTLALRAANVLLSTGTVSVGGGTLDIDGFNQAVGAVTLTGGSIVGTTGVLSASSYSVQSGSASAILDTATAVLTKSGAGTVTLSGNNTYGGGTQVTAGTLVVNGAQTGGGNTTVSAGGTLAGTGTLGLKSGAAVGVSGSGVTQAFIAPGNGTSGNVGTLTLGTSGNSNVVSLSGLSTVAIDINGGTADKLAVNGGLVISSGSNLTLNTVATPTAGLYQLVTYTGTRSGTTFSASGTPSGYKVVYGASSNGSIDLQHLATQSITGASPATADAFVNSTLAASGTLNNTAPTQSVSLNVSLSSTGALTVGSLTSGSGTVTPSGSTSVSGTINTGTTSGAGKTWEITNTDANASNTTAAGGGTVNVYDHASGSATNTTVMIPTVIVGYGSAQTSTGGVSVSNASTTGLRVKLDANASAAQGNVSLDSVTGVAAGSGGTGQAHLGTGQGVGTYSKTFTYTYADNTTGTNIASGANTNLGTANVTVQGDVLGHAGPTFSNNHIGGTVNVIQNTAIGQTVTLTNGTAGSHIAGLAIDALTMITRSGSGVIAAGGSETLTANLNTAALGSGTQSFSVSMFDDHAYDGKGAASAGTQGFSTTVNVYQHADAQLATGTFAASYDPAHTPPYSNGSGDASYTPVAPTQTLSNGNHTIGIDFGTIWATPYDNPYPVYAYFDITNPLSYAVTVAMTGVSGGATVTPGGTSPTWALQAADGSTFNVTALAAGGVYHARVLFNTNDPTLHLPDSPFKAAWDVSLTEDQSVTGASTTAQVLHINAQAIAVPTPVSALAGLGLLGGLGIMRYARSRRFKAEQLV